MSVTPVVLQAQSGFGVETVLAKNNNSTYYVQNTASSAVAVSQEQEPLLGFGLQTVPAIDASGGIAVLTNPTQPGLYAVLLDFGATGGYQNLSCIANYGLAGASAPPYRWIGGAEASVVAQFDNIPLEFIQIAPNETDGTTLVIGNYSDTATPPAVATFVKLGANMGF
jgi:hypothetical protein